MRCRWSILPLLLLVRSVSAEEPGRLLERALANVTRDHVTKLLSLADEAAGAGQAATARLWRERVLELEPDHMRARFTLGYRFLRQGTWDRTPERSAEVLSHADTDAAIAAPFAVAAKALELRWVAEQVRVCGKYANEQEKRTILGALLLRDPQNEGVRGALGHVRIRGRWTSPELVALAERAPRGRAHWQAIVMREVAPEPPELTIAVPGLAEELSVFPAAARYLATTDTPEVAARYVEGVVRTQALLSEVLGPSDRRWNPRVLLFLAPTSYEAMVRALHPDGETAAFYLRYDNYEHAEFYAIRSYEPLGATERYAHGAGHLTAFERSAPPLGKGSMDRDAEAYPWLREGLGYFVSFEVIDRGYLQFVSVAESSAKRNYTRDVPALKTREACLLWLQEQLAAGNTYPLREVCGMRLNALDFCASMQAWSFVRLLLLWDGEAFQRLPEALRTATEGSDLERTERALRQCYKKGLDEWESLWRGFALEVDGEELP